MLPVRQQGLISQPKGLSDTYTQIKVIYQISSPPQKQLTGSLAVNVRHVLGECPISSLVQALIYA